MDGTRKTGVWLAGAAAVLWVGFAALMAATPEDGGANIGGGLLGLFAMAVSVAAAVTLIVAVRTVAVRTLAALSFVAWVAYLALAVDDTGPRALAFGILAAGVVLLAAAAVLAVRPHRRDDVVRG